jgi:hypothetical protein
MKTTSMTDPVYKIAILIAVIALDFLIFYLDKELKDKLEIAIIGSMLAICLIFLTFAFENKNNSMTDTIIEILSLIVGCISITLFFHFLLLVSCYWFLSHKIWLLSISILLSIVTTGLSFIGSMIINSMSSPKIEDDWAGLETEND